MSATYVEFPDAPDMMRAKFIKKKQFFARLYFFGRTASPGLAIQILIAGRQQRGLF